MITREEAKAYLDRVTEAWVALLTPIHPEDELWLGDNVHHIDECTKRQIHLSDIKPLARALGHPFIRVDFSENSDKVYFHYNGFEIFSLEMYGAKRIGKKSA